MMKSLSNNKIEGVHQKTGRLVRSGLPCLFCGSSDAVALYSDGNTHCFSCGKTVFNKDNVSNNGEVMLQMSENLNIKIDENEVQENENEEFEEVNTGVIKEIPSRGLTEESCRFWKYGITKREVNPKTGQLEYSQVANFYNSKNELIGQKFRFQYEKDGKLKKTFKVKGNINTTLYGKWLWSTGKKIVITEGEIDAISVSQALNHKYPVVSLPHGCDSAKRVLTEEKEWLIKNFDEIVLMFDSDEHGKNAMKEVSSLFDPGKLKIVELPLKDANEMLLAGRSNEIQYLIYRAKPYQSPGIITAREVLENPLQTVESGDSFPWEEITKWNKGMRDHEMYAWGAGTGVSKTDTTKDVMAHILSSTDKKVGLIYLEEPDTLYTISSIAAKMVDLNYVLIDEGEFDKQDKVRKQAENIQDRVVLYKPTGDDIDTDLICNIIRDMVVIHNCNHIVLDHVTYLVDGKDNQLILMQKLMAALNRVNKNLPFKLHYISHLRKTGAGGKNHEEGGRITVDDFVGGKAVVQYSSMIFALEGDRQHEDEFERNITTIRCLKCRLFGFNAGKTCLLRYDIGKGKKFQMTEEEIKDLKARREVREMAKKQKGSSNFNSIEYSYE